ncbi:hypothetical protein IAI10_20930 [Clostridium sp. 19966]|uniref:hypothetical protein n=1 Tax=Clostridium sp. 19966 TaxID=2768166 RepID=UPI0028DFA373|nr:hypothetical protein [Clostridium sp. 19966]MDT8719118.1 hypothetical protein [Clostridium sp. 19966]
MSYNIKGLIKGMFPYIVAFFIIAAIMKLLVYIIPIALIGYGIYKLYFLVKEKINSYRNRVAFNHKQQKTFAYYRKKSYTSFVNIFTKSRNNEYKVSGENTTFYTSSNSDNNSKVIDVDYEEVK